MTQQNPAQRVKSASLSFSSQWALGFTATTRGKRLLSQHPTLWPHIWTPLVANILLSLTVLIAWALLWWWLADIVNGWIDASVTPLTILSYLLKMLAVVFTGVTTAAACLLLWRIAQGILLPILFADLSLQVEKCLGVDTESLKAAGWSQAIADTGVQVAALIALQVFALALNGIPLLGSLLAAALNLVGTTSLLGLDLVALPMAARGVSRAQQLRTAYDNVGLCSGLGTSLLLWQAVPILGGWGTTLCLIGATELYHTQLAKAPNTLDEQQGD